MLLMFVLIIKYHPSKGNHNNMLIIVSKIILPNNGSYSKDINYP